MAYSEASHLLQQSTSLQWRKRGENSQPPSSSRGSSSDLCGKKYRNAEKMYAKKFVSQIRIEEMQEKIKAEAVKWNGKYAQIKKM